MAADFNPYASERHLPGINLAHYYPEKRNGNTVRYVHKKFLQQPKNDKLPKPHHSKEKPVKETKKTGKSKMKKKKRGVATDNKSVQFNSEPLKDIWKENNTNIVMATNDSVLGETIKFAKNIVPLVIQPDGKNDSASSVFYTVKVSQKSNKRPKKHDNSESRDITFKREKTKKMVETYRNEKIYSQRESLSFKETVSFGSQNNTIDEIHNPSLCCSLSEISEKKHHKMERLDKKAKQNDLFKLAASESFEALATELVKNSGEAKVKIHLMKEADKNILSESIKAPLIKAIKECFIELTKCHSTVNTEITTLQRHLTCNTDKLDNVLEKLSCVEKILDELSKVNTQVKPPTGHALNRASTLESLGQDLSEVKEEGEDSSERECYEEDLTERRKNREKSAIVRLRSKIVEKEVENSERRQAGGEEGSTSRFETGSLLAKLERPNRIPARFCWTDARGKT